MKAAIDYFSHAITSYIDSISSSASEDIGFLCAARTIGEQLAGIPEDWIIVSDLVDRQVAFKHRA
jgi:hypothetical protein